MLHPNGNVVCVVDPVHITRLLAEGGHEVPEQERPVPTPIESDEAMKIKALEKQIALLLAEREVADGSTRNDERSDKSGANDDRRPRRRKPAVHRSNDSG